MDSTSVLGTHSSLSGSRILARIVIGVTGHRKLSVTLELTKAIRSAIEQIRQMSPSLSATPIGLAILTPLADGADRLVAQEVLKVSGSMLEVVLPMNKDDYLQDFETEQSKKEFEDLLSRATSIRRPVFKGSRSETYEQVGRYVVDQCDVLIALWDGKQAEGQGGTADIVHYARQNRCPLLWINTEDTGKVTTEPGRGLNAKAYYDLDEYNSEPMDMASFEKQSQAQRDFLISRASAAKLPSTTLQPTIEYFLHHYVRADLLASHYQKRYYWMEATVYVLATAAVALAATQLIFFSGHPRILIAEVVFMVAVLLIIWLGHRQRWHAKWLDYRFLAERFRSAMWIALSNIDVAALRPPRHLSLAYSPNDWMVAAFASVWSRRPRLQAAEPLSNEGFKDFLSEAWLEDQIRYQDSSGRGHYQRHQIMYHASNALFGLTLLAAILHVTDFASRSLEQALALMVIAFPAIAASISAIRTHRDYLRKSMRSSEMAGHLRELKDRVTQAKDHESLLRLVTEVEETMLHENEDWRVVVRFHTTELPV